MYNLVHIASGGFDGLFWVVVVIIAIIAQIVKSRKQFDQGAPKQDAPPGGDPAEELRKFLDGLGQAQKAPPAPPPVPPTPVPPPTPRPTPKQAAPSRPPPVQAPRPPPVVRRMPEPPVPVREVVTRPRAPEPEHVPTEAEVMARFRAELAAKATTGKKVTRWQRLLAEQLSTHDRRLLQEAMLLREILGPPVALRRRETPYPLV